ncbi:uncharacterized protein LOC124896584 [Capsicum annuum]|uniref:uncharacterized protein LOC124896584 n=1 Tax=Capsicum annuum TaxID=4072 RepID=UPI001FB0BD69|nr:uncharacterized protein LOC124896584 [Capsicum annuum]
MEETVPPASVIDHTHHTRLLYLSSSDIPGVVQVGFPLTGIDNYSLWSRAMRLILLTKNKLDLKQWNRCNAIVISWIISNVSQNLVSGILFRSNAYLVWNDLRERFDKVNIDLWDEFDSIIPPFSCDCAKFKDYAENMMRRRLLQFLMGLNDSYSQARIQILLMNPTPNINQCYTMIVQDESQKALTGDSYSFGKEILDPTALFTRSAPRSHGYGGVGGGSSNSYFGSESSSSGGAGPFSGYSGGSVHSGAGSSGSQRQGKQMFCDYCNMRGHSKDTCYKFMHCSYCNQKGHTKDTC